MYKFDDNVGGAHDSEAIRGFIVEFDFDTQGSAWGVFEGEAQAVSEAKRGELISAPHDGGQEAGFGEDLVWGDGLVAHGEVAPQRFGDGDELLFYIHFTDFHSNRATCFIIHQYVETRILYLSCQTGPYLLR